MKKIYYILLTFLIILVFSCDSKENESLQNKQSLESSSKNTIIHNEIKEQENKISFKLNLKDFIPKNYALLDSASGNLNLDEYKDYVFVLKKIDEEKTSDVNEHPEKRPLIILIGQQDGTFKQIKRNDNAVYCVDCGGMMGDPFTGITLEKGSFTITHFGGSNWRWSKNITFKFPESENEWFLYQIESSSFHTSDPEKAEQEILTKKDFGKVKFEKYDIYKED
ncbi:MAG: hypothetical protein ACK5B9_14905 [Flavobacteriia bacterium]|jgi:hypothetical protein